MEKALNSQKVVQLFHFTEGGTTDPSKNQVTILCLKTVWILRTYALTIIINYFILIQSVLESSMDMCCCNSIYTKSSMLHLQICLPKLLELWVHFFQLFAAQMQRMESHRQALFNMLPFDKSMHSSAHVAHMICKTQCSDSLSYIVWCCTRLGQL